MSYLSDIYVNIAQDRVVESNATGTLRTVTLTPRRSWALGLNLREMLIGLRINSISGGRLTVLWQYSLDAQKWKDGTALINQVTAVDDYFAVMNTPAQIPPFVRLAVQMDDGITPTIQRTALISAWSLYKYNK